MKLVFIASLLALVGCAHVEPPPNDSLVVDHILYAGPNLDSLVKEVAQESGTQPIMGGEHSDLGTHNAILPLQDATYLELIAPDPKSHVKGGAEVLGIGKLSKPKIVAWAVRVRAFDKTYARFIASGIKVSPILEGSRRGSDGKLSQWRYFYVTDERFSEVPRMNPFFISYTNSRKTSRPQCQLASLKGTHPHPEKFAEISKIVKLKMEITRSDKTDLHVEMNCPKGRVSLQ